MKTIYDQDRSIARFAAADLLENAHHIFVIHAKFGEVA